jgi:hypothetical protein
VVCFLLLLLLLLRYACCCWGMLAAAAVCLLSLFVTQHKIQCMGISSSSQTYLLFPLLGQ